MFNCFMHVFADTYEKQLEGGNIEEDFSDTDIDFAR